MEPNLGTIELHAAGSNDGVGGAIANPVNAVGVVRNGAGDYTITLASQIDETQRFIAIIADDTDGVMEHVLANDTDATFDVAATTNAGVGVAADHAFSFAVFRTVKLG